MHITSARLLHQAACRMYLNFSTGRGRKLRGPLPVRGRLLESSAAERGPASQASVMSELIRSLTVAGPKAGLPLSTTARMALDTTMFGAALTTRDDSA